MTKQVYKVGETIPLRIEIRSHSNESLLLVREIPEANQSDRPTHLEVNLIDGLHRTSPFNAKTGASLPTPGESDAVAVARWWVLLEPESFYGRIVHIQASDFDFLKKTGRYQFQIKFSSSGGYPPAIAARLVSPDPKVPKMPYPIWTGKLSCSSDWFEIKGK